MFDETMDALRVAAQKRASVLLEFLWDRTEGTVYSGSIKGMQLRKKQSWGESLPKLVGTYEQDLHDDILEIPKQGYDYIVNVGAAEGYYAVGLARLLPSCEVWAFDISEVAEEICTRAAEENGVLAQVHVGGRCSHQTLVQLLKGKKRAFLLVDIEGGEKKLLDPKLVPNLRKVDFLIECHDALDSTITETLFQGFQRTHHMKIVKQGARNPSEIDRLEYVSELDRWLIVNEGRTYRMYWLVGRSRIGRPYRVWSDRCSMDS